MARQEEMNKWGSQGKHEYGPSTALQNLDLLQKHGQFTPGQSLPNWEPDKY